MRIGFSEFHRTFDEAKSRVAIINASAEAFISRLAEGAIDGVIPQGVEFRVASGLLQARDQKAVKYVLMWLSSFIKFCGRLPMDLLRRSIFVILLYQSQFHCNVVATSSFILHPGFVP